VTRADAPALASRRTDAVHIAEFVNAPAQGDEGFEIRLGQREHALIAKLVVQLAVGERPSEVAERNVLEPRVRHVRCKNACL
jgi:hypothetical protein